MSKLPIKLFVLGLDGACFDLIQPWLDQDKLPTFQALVAEGASGPMESCIPPITCPAWKCYSTGKYPGKLGVFWWEQLDLPGRRVILPNATSFRSAEVWDYLNEAGLRTGVVGMPMTYPPRPIRGFMVAGGPDCPATGYTYPEQLEDELKMALGYRTQGEISATERAVADALDLIEMQLQAAEYLADHYPVDFLHLTSFQINGPLQHFLYDDQPVLEAWQRVDRWLARFAELEKSPEHIHTYRLTPLSLWNAASSGLSGQDIVGALEKYSKYDLPGNVRVDIYDYISRYGRVKMIMRDGALLLVSDDRPLIAEIARHKRMQPFIIRQADDLTLQVDATQRGHVKLVLVQIGYPAEDLAGYVTGAELSFRLLPVTNSDQPFSLRQYQQEAVDVFYARGQVSGGSGVIVLPCGAGKTMIGMGVMEKLQTATLILTPSTVAVRQWIDELLDKTDLSPDDIGEYSGLVKEIRPVTISTYQILTYRKRRTDTFPHFKLFNERNWGLIIYDEVHLLPAPVFRITAEIQSRRRLGLTATLIREDGRETDVFSLIGPKKYDVPWKDLEKQGWIASAECHEIRLPLPDDLRMEYAVADQRKKFRLSAENPAKLKIIKQLLIKHREDTVLVMGTYLDQLHEIAEAVGAPLITGKTPVRERRKLFEQIRQGELGILVVSKVANFSIDLPDVNVAIQVSGTFGSRQEEAQRLGRILRPKKHGLLAHFYTLVTRDTRDQEFAARRQLFLTEEGYRYEILYDHEIADYEPVVMDVEAGEPSSRLLPAEAIVIDGELA